MTNVSRARAFRRSPTDAERLLRQRLRSRQIAGAKFRRQQAFGPYVLDFYCHDRGLVLEIDGSQHFWSKEAAQDAERTRYFEERGLRVIRFTNLEVLKESEAVLERILLELESPHPNPLP